MAAGLLVASSLPAATPGGDSESPPAAAPESWRKALEIDPGPRPPRDCLFSPDGKALLALFEHEGRIYDAQTGRERFRLPVEGGEPPVWERMYGNWHDVVRGGSFSPDGSLAMVFDGNRAYLWDMATGAARGRPAVQGVWAAAFSPAKPHRVAVAGSYGKGILVWNTETAKEERALEAPRSVYCLAFLPDGSRLASGGSDGTVRIWDLASGGQIGRWGATRDIVEVVAVSPDGTLIASVSPGDHGPILWDIERGARERELSFEGAPGTYPELFSCAFSPDGSTVLAIASTGGRGRVLAAWDAGTGGRKWSDRSNGFWYRFSFSRDGRRILRPGDPPRVLDAATGRVLADLGDGEEAHVAAFSPDDSRAVLCGKEIAIWRRDEKRADPPESPPSAPQAPP